MNRKLSEYEQLLKRCEELPKGNWRAYAELSDELVGPMLMTRERSFLCFVDPVKAMKKAKRLAERMDFKTRGSSLGVVYGIENEK